MLLQCEWRLAFRTDYAPPIKNSLFKNKKKHTFTNRMYLTSNFVTKFHLWTIFK